MTPKQKQLLDFIKDYLATSGGVSPSYEEMRTGTGLKSRGGIHRLVHALVAHGYITLIPGMNRSIKLVA